MAYQNVGTPRFYVDHGLWLHSSGVKDFYEIDTYTNLSYEMLLLNPSVDKGIFVDVDQFAHIEIARYAPVNYIAVLGHQMGGNLYIPEYYPRDIAVEEQVSVVNGGTVNEAPQYDGFSISTFLDDPSAERIGITIVGYYLGQLNTVSFGSYYDMKNAPNLSLTMGREFGDTNEFTTHNGSSMSNTMWSRPPLWGTEAAWELYASAGPTPALHMVKSGRRTWDLEFSYMDDGDLWGSNQSLQGDVSGASAFLDDPWATHIPFGTWGGGDGTIDTDGDWSSEAAGGTTVHLYNILTDDNFFSQVWHKTLGGTLPFIFQPDKDNSNPDQFCIARFKDNSLKATQSAFNVYDISVSIEEVW